MISYNSALKTFKLDTRSSSYIFGIGEDGTLIHYYYGAPLGEDNVAYLGERFGLPGVFAKPHYAPGGTFTMGSSPLEYPTYGVGDYRPVALAIRSADGHSTTDIHYLSHEIVPGKPCIPGQPATFGSPEEVSTLIITCIDRLTLAEVTLYYAVFEDASVITRWVSVKNTSNRPFDIEQVLSASVDYNTHDYDTIHLWGRWCRERMVERLPVSHLRGTVCSTRGCSGHDQNPFLALVAKNTCERHGEAYGFNLVYGGNFAITANADSYDSTRVTIGINPEGFSWHTQPGETFYAPEAVMVYSAEGIGGMSREFHAFYEKHLINPRWMAAPRPLLINNWEATYFRFDEEKLLDIGRAAKELGIEMLVLDDGWFGHRANDRSSLGDWYVFAEKLPAGLNSLSQKLHDMGLKFGLWFEPEMVSPDSDLFRAHPDWVLHIDGRPMSLGRYQLILDFSRADVCDYIFDSMCKILDTAKIEYVKWDYNRNFTEVGSAILPPERQKEVPHRYILGLYSVLDRLTKRYPDLLIEGCSSGGGRFDPSMLFFSPQIWTSDNSDAIERLDIQYGTSLCYPVSSMGAHVSASPNHQVKRSTSLTTRGFVALEGSFGYELDAGKFTDEEKEIVKKQVADFHRFYHITHGGKLYRLVNPLEGERDFAAWEMVSPDQSEALVTAVIIRTHAAQRYFLRLEGLDPNRRYREEASGNEYLGSTLMNAGLNFIKFIGDGNSQLLYFKAVD